MGEMAVILFCRVYCGSPSGGEAAGAAGRGESGGPDREPDADGGDGTRHGQHPVPELHGLPRRRRQGACD